MKESLKDSGIPVTSIKSIGISNQRNTFVTWDKTNSKPAHNFISWQDTRGAMISTDLNNSYLLAGLRSLSAIAHKITGGQRWAAGTSIGFSTVQACVGLAWVLRNNEESMRLHREGKLLFGTIDSWLLWKMTEGTVHATEYSNISATGLWDPFIMNWNTFGIKLLGIPTSIFPKVLESSGEFGKLNPAVLGTSIPIAGICADNHAALFGQCCFQPGDVKCSLGTGCFMAMNTGDNAYASVHGLYPLVAWRFNAKTVYMVEGVGKNAGGIIEWAKSCGFIDSIEAATETAQSISDTDGIYFVPGISGLSHPYLDDTATGLLLGLNRNSKKEQIVRAILESISFTIKDLASTIDLDIPDLKMKCVLVDGGVTHNEFIMQYAADLLNMEIRVASQKEMSSQGVAFLAGIWAGIWKQDELYKLNPESKIFSPNPDENSRNKNSERFSEWVRAVQRSLLWNHKSSS
eukprot:TRINITY_DN6408_c0_g2_i2.p1 TRINITY_DN6408_c0_g2~~TRINITY_DN6408_c0_g2_i2.p1  ORF type:complete len:520 (-),score=121.83 TRINITY_DN6408_c0_g2_i2:41-1423(-)